MLVGCAARRHIPAPWNGLRKSTKPAGMPRTTSELKPSSGINKANCSSNGSSSKNLWQINSITLVKLHHSFISHYIEMMGKSAFWSYLSFIASCELIGHGLSHSYSCID